MTYANGLIRIRISPWEFRISEKKFQPSELTDLYRPAAKSPRNRIFTIAAAENAMYVYGMKARYLVNKGKRLEQKLHDLQFLIYAFAGELEDLRLNNFSELASESGFELDVSHSKMKELWEGIEQAFCRKITK